MTDAVLVLAPRGRRELPPGALFALAKEPHLEAGPNGRPPFGLSVFLSARPDPVRGSVAELITWGFATFNVSVAPAAEALTQAGRDLSRAVTPLFFERFEATLRARGPGGVRVLARAAAAGPVGRVQLMASLDKGDAGLLLAALKGSDGLSVGATVSFAIDGVADTRAWEVPLARFLEGLGAGAAEVFYPDPDKPAHFRPLEPLIASARPRGDGRGEGAEEHMLSRGFPEPTARALALTPDRRVSPSAHALLASEVVHPMSAHAWAAADVVVEPPQGASIESLPIVADPAAPLWSDRASGRKFYAPSFTLRLPEPSDPPETSAFAFVLTRTGATADPNVPALTATARFTVDIGRSDAVAQALAAAGGAEGVPLPLGNLSARLDVPFRDGASGELHVQSFVGKTEATPASLTITVDLLGEWVRLLYGVLSYPGFQTEPARLKVAYAFTAYVPMSDLSLRLAYVDKIAAVPLIANRSELPTVLRGPVLDVSTATLHVVGAAMALEREMPPAGSRAPPAVHAAAVHQMIPVAALTLAQPAAQPAPEPAIVARPQLALSAEAALALRKPRYATQTIVREESVDVTLDCAKYGALYLQNTDHGQVAIGCSDVLKLGQLEYRLYDEIPSLGASTHRVFRSLQQPGRFLVAPSTYRITRYGPGEPESRRYRPVALIYALVGAPPEESTYWFTATLEPDLPAHIRAGLLVALAPLSPHGVNPALDFPTDPAVNAAISYSWALPPSIEAPSVQALWSSFQVSVSTGLHQGVVLKELIEHSGLRGAATFRLPDGLALAAQLVLDTVVAGPWDGGPVPARIDGTCAVLKNAILQPVDVVSVLALRAGAPQTIPVNRTLAPGDETAAELGFASDAVWAVTAQPQPATLAELAVFEEDVSTSVHFINQVSLANHALSGLSVRARVKGSAREYEADLEDLGTATLDLVFPLTTYLEGQVLQYLLTATPASGAVRSGPWREWDLAATGNVIGITADQLP